MKDWVENLTKEELQAAGLLPHQMRERYQRQLAVLRLYASGWTPDGQQLQAALRAALRATPRKGR